SPPPARAAWRISCPLRPKNRRPRPEFSRLRWNLGSRKACNGCRSSAYPVQRSGAERPGRRTGAGRRESSEFSPDQSVADAQTRRQVQPEPEMMPTNDPVAQAAVREAVNVPELRRETALDAHAASLELARQIANVGHAHQERLAVDFRPELQPTRPVLQP